MTAPRNRSWRDTTVTWATVIAMALVTAWSANPLLTVLLQIALGEEPRSGPSSATLLISGCLLVFAGAVLLLLRQGTARLRIEAGSLWSGCLLWLSVPAMVLLLFVVAGAEQGTDQGAATAAFFMLMIFGGYNAIIGSLLLLLAFVLRRQRRETERMSFPR